MHQIGAGNMAEVTACGWRRKMGEQDDIKHQNHSSMWMLWTNTQYLYNQSFCLILECLYQVSKKVWLLTSAHIVTNTFGGMSVRHLCSMWFVYLCLSSASPALWVCFCPPFDRGHGGGCVFCRDRTGGNVSQSVLHGVINSFVNVEEYKKKAPLKVLCSIQYIAHLVQNTPPWWSVAPYVTVIIKWLRMCDNKAINSNSDISQIF